MPTMRTLVEFLEATEREASARADQAKRLLFARLQAEFAGRSLASGAGRSPMAGFTTSAFPTSRRAH